MGVNRDKPDRWKEDVKKSVDLYNNWFMEFAPQAFKNARNNTTQAVLETLKITNYLTNIKVDLLEKNPGILTCLRMCTCPPIARDRLIGLAGVSKNLVEKMEKDLTLPSKMKPVKLRQELTKICKIIQDMSDREILTWLETSEKPTQEELMRASSIIADRLCTATANPIIRNSQEKRQLELISNWLEQRGYRYIKPKTKIKLKEIELGTYTFRLNVVVKQDNARSVNIPIDVVIMPKNARVEDLPLLIEAKSAGDFTNTNKRRKEEAKKMQLLKNTYDDKQIQYILFLCGYFDSGYLGYEAAEGIDWVWEHRIDDLADFGV